MKKKMSTLFVFLLAGSLFLFGCQSREDAAKDTEETSEPSVIEPVSETSVEPETPSATPEPVLTSEERSEIISTVGRLLKNAIKCDDIYTGDLPYDENLVNNIDGEEALYYFVNSDITSLGDIESLWTKTFNLKGTAFDFYNSMLGSNLYLSINGELYVKEHTDRPPMTVGEWDISTLRVVSIEETSILVTMDTKLVGQPNGESTLVLEKSGDQWLMTDSYFLG